MTNTSKLGLFIVGSDGNQNIETTLANNFQKIDDAHPDNKDVLDKISQSGTETSFDLSGMAERTDLHSHTNEDILDKITQSGAETTFDLSSFASKDDVANAGGGDMLKSVYDTNNNGKVDSAESADSVPWTGVQSKPTFATVATSGNYTDLSNKPAIPTTTSQLTNDSGFVTDGGLVGTKSVDETNLADGKILEYDSTSGKYILVDKPTGAGNGDMLKSTYDTDNSGVVDDAEKLGGQLPSYYATKRWIDVKDLGAIGDGIADDTIIIQSAIDSITGKGVVYFPPNYTFLCGTLSLKSNIVLQGAGRELVTIKLKNGVNGSLFSASLKDNLQIKDMTIDGNSANQTTGSPVTFWKSRNNLISNVKVINSYTIALNMSNVENTTIEKCYLSGTLNNTVISFSNDDSNYAKGNNIIRGNIIENGWLDGIIYNTDNGIIEGNIVRNNGLATDNTAGGIYSNTHAGLIISDNTISGNDGNGVDLMTCKDLTITGNRCISNNSAGIMLSGCTDATISSNICKNNGAVPATDQNDGITLLGSCENVAITGNRCFDTQTIKTQEYGIELKGYPAKVSITGNICNGNKLGDVKNSSNNGETSDIHIFGNVPFNTAFTSDIPYSFSLATNATLQLIPDSSRIAIVEIYDKSGGGVARLMLRGTSNFVDRLYDPYGMFDPTNSGSAPGRVYYDSTTSSYLMKNMAASTRYYSYRITYM